MTDNYDEVWIDARLATLDDAVAAPYGGIEDAVLAVRDGLIAYAGPREGLDEAAAHGARVRSAEGRWITPALVDCHTHLVYAGERAREFEMRLAGASYEDIARAGGGIVATVAATRAASEETLIESARRRLAGLKAEGVTLIEIKSGYGLDLDTELKMLRVARKLGYEDTDVEIVTTFLGAHALPPEYAGRADDYITFVCEEVMPAVAREGLADAVDCFCERIGFSLAQTERVFETAKRLGLPVKLHAEQLSDQGGAALAARHAALSADHLEYLGEDGITAMAAAGTAARRVLLPARDPVAATRRAAPRARADRHRQRLQPGQFPGRLAAADAQHGLHAVPHDPGGGARRRHAPRRPRPRPRRYPRHAGERQTGRLRRLGHRPPGRACLPHRREPVRPDHQGRPPGGVAVEAGVVRLSPCLGGPVA